MTALSRFLYAGMLVSGFAQAAPAEAKTLVYCSEASPETFNPMLAVAESTMDASAKTIFNRLVEFKGGTTEIAPALAESWDISSDGKTYVFHLRKGVKFQSNDDFTPTRDFNADDVMYTFKRQLDPKDQYHALGGGRYEYFDALGLGSMVKSIEKTDEYGVKITLNQANSAFLNNIAIDYLSILSLEQTEAYVKAGYPEKIDQTPVGTGPFRFVDYQLDGAIRYEVNNDYWRGRPKIDTLIFAITPDPSVRVQKLKAGECDTITQPNASDLGDLGSDPDVTVVTLEGQNIGVVGFNVEREALKDKRVRVALARAINRKAIVDAVYQGAGAAARGILPPLMIGAATDADPNSYDVAAAKTLLKEAGVEAGLSVTLWAMPVSRPYNPNARRMAEMVQSDWQAIGVKAEIVSFEWGEYLKRTAAGEHDAFLLGGSSDNGDPDNLLSYMLSCGGVQGGSNRSRWCSPEFDKLLDEGRSATDRASRAAIYEKAQSIIDAEAPVIAIAHSKVSVPMGKRVTKFELDAFGRQNFENYDVAD